MTNTSPPRVTVGLADAEESDLAVRWAARHAQRIGGTLHLLHAFMWTELDVDTDPIPGMVGSGIRQAAQTLVKEAVAIARAEVPDLEITSEVVDGNAVPVLVAGSTGSEVMVVGGRGMGRLMTLVVGSKSLALAARAHCPVVVVRGHLGEEGPIGVVHDGTTAVALERAADLAAAYDRDLHLILRADTAADAAESIRVEVAERLALSHPGVFVRGVTVAATESAKELIRASEDAALIVVAGEHAKGPDGPISAPRRLVTVLRYAHAPVWIERA
ncbi:universal stress protein [Brachybacterium sp. J144]|uniref:universal stress protein n=1 Tax=Brachybacterium sp. J144 TaxID=3116487 RepID=UPI002E7A232E|nr:universal stress protein [Brachybacterium sp. J144]MEE1649796.1 universal stress protein [Brachybacterium sp. J144]